MWVDDQILRVAGQDLVTSAFQPNSYIVVLGCSNRPEKELRLEECKRAGIPILRRYGGGGAVLLYPGCIVVSIGAWVQSPYHNDRYFYKINQSIIDCLASLDQKLGALGQAGISDITYGNKKVAGTSMFRSRNYLLYQASILFDVDFSAIESFLGHPTREPEYRGARRHRDFVVGLNTISCQVSQGEVLSHLNSNLSWYLRRRFGNELIESMPTQVKNLHARAERGTNL